MHHLYDNHLSHQAAPLVIPHLTHSQAVGFLMICFFGFFCIFFIVNIFYTLSIYKTLSYVPQDKRAMPNAFIWLSYIPLAGIIFYWLMQLIGIPSSLSNALSNNVDAIREVKKLRLISLIHIFPIHMQPGQQLIVREHQFLAATNNIEYHFEIVRGLLNKIAGGGSFIVDRFSCADRAGILWIHGNGNVFEKVLAPGEQIDLREGSWVYRDPSVNMETKAHRLTAGLLASADGFVVNRFTGPGRLGIQTFSMM